MQTANYRNQVTYKIDKNIKKLINAKINCTDYIFKKE